MSIDQSQALTTDLRPVQADPLQSSPIALSTASSPVAADASSGLGGISGNVSYTGTTARVIDSDLTITNVAPLNGARVLIGNFDATKDSLGINGATSGTQNGVSWSYDQTKGVLSLDSASPVSSDIYQTLLRQATYSNSDASNPGAARTIQFSLGNLLADPNNGHFYQFVSNAGISWTDARTAASNSNYLGRTGYLVTITSQSEQDFVQSRVNGNGWIGASDTPDLPTKEQWRWVTGPEGQQDAGKGLLFWQGLGVNFNNGVSGTGPVGGGYSNWDLQRGEPNNKTDASQPNGEDYAHIVGNAQAGNIGKWNDLPNQRDYTDLIAYQPQGYIVEFGGLSGDSSPTISASVTLNFGGNVGGTGGTSNAAVGTTTTVPNFDNTSGPEILWRNYGTSNAAGQNQIWNLIYDGTNSPNAFTLNPNPILTKFIQEAKDTNWEIVGLYDADRNGISDIFWRNYSTGENTIWLMKFDPNTGVEVDTNRSGSIKAEPDVTWEINGVMDFDNNGAPDILWHNRRTGQTSIWAYDKDPNNTTTFPFTFNVDRSKVLNKIVSSDWYIEGWADFNNDKVADVLWRNYKTGENFIWKLKLDASGDNPYYNLATDGYGITTVPDVNWEVADLVDFNSDGVADIVWRNYKTGVNYVWGMLSGANIDETKTGPIPEVTDTNWRLEGAADFTGDGIADLLWRNYSTGEDKIWGMNVANNKYIRTQEFPITTLSDVTWEIEGPSPTRDVA